MPLRTCLGCRRAVAASGLLRLVAERSPAGDLALVPDPQRRRGGRGFWLHPNDECLAGARRGGFARALRTRLVDDAAVAALVAASANTPDHTVQNGQSAVPMLDTGDPMEEPK